MNKYVYITTNNNTIITRALQVFIQPLDQANWLKSRVSLKDSSDYTHHHPMIITQPENWRSFYDGILNQLCGPTQPGHPTVDTDQLRHCSKSVAPVYIVQGFL